MIEVTRPSSAKTQIFYIHGSQAYKRNMVTIKMFRTHSQGDVRELADKDCRSSRQRAASKKFTTKLFHAGGFTPLPIKVRGITTFSVR